MKNSIIIGYKKNQIYLNRLFTFYTLQIININMRNIGDLVLIYYKGKPSIYARIESIEPDIKEGWYQVKLLILSIPAQIIQWILKEEYIDGHTFTIGGIPIRLGDIQTESFSQFMCHEKEASKKDSLQQKVKNNIKNHSSGDKIIELNKHRKK